MDAGRRAWATIEPLIEPIAASLPFNAREPVLKLRSEFSASVMVPSDGASAMAASVLAPYLGPLVKEIKSILGAARIGLPAIAHGNAAAGEGGTPDRVAVIVTTTPILHPDDVKILRALASTETTQNQYWIEQNCGLSRRTLSDRLAKLRTAGLTHRPNGDRGGEAITDAGRAAIPNDALRAVR